MTELLTTTPVLIGVTGKKRHGKGTFGGVAREMGFIEINFADKLREMVADLNPIVHFPTDSDCLVPWRYNEVVEKFGYEMAKNYFPEVVRVLQVFGSEVIRGSDPEFWVRVWRNKYLSGAYKRVVAYTEGLDMAVWQPVVVTDVRFNNEAEAIRDLGGIVVQVVRPGYIHDSEHDKHTSEQGVDSSLIDHQIVASSVEKLREMAGDFINAMPQLWNPINPTARPVPAEALPQ